MAEPTPVQPAGLGALQLSPKSLFFEEQHMVVMLGGAKTKELVNITKNKLWPIGLWLQCRMLWLCRIGDSYFTSTSNASTEINNVTLDNDDDIHDD